MTMMMMIQTVRRRNDDDDESRQKKRKKRKEKKSSVFLLFCVSVGSFCDELTVVFRSFVRVRFLLIHKLLIGAGGVGGAGVCFLFPTLPGTDATEEGPREKINGRPPTGRRNRRMICTTE